jgi:hypothetical protein
MGSSGDGALASSDGTGKQIPVQHSPAVLACCSKPRCSTFNPAIMRTQTCRSAEVQWFSMCCIACGSATHFLLCSVRHLHCRQGRGVSQRSGYLHVAELG